MAEALVTHLGDLALPEVWCTRPESVYLALKAQISAWLTTPSLMFPIFLVLVGIPWLWRQGRWRAWGSGLAALLMILYGIAPLPPILEKAEQLLVDFTPKDDGQPAEVAVILGRGRERSRITEAVDLWQQGRVPLIFTSGHIDGPRMAQQLRRQGIPETAIQFEGCSLTTEENAQFTAAYLKAQGIRRIILITDPPHLLRSWLSFRSLGFEVIPHPSATIGSTHRDPYRRALTIYREYAGLVSYALRGRFFPRQPMTTLVALHYPEAEHEPDPMQP
jgi:uncharacterized SAM-binding protein YcdF (DUF218 family)